jgi:hypothetical protein
MNITLINIKMRLLFKGIRNVYEDTRMNNYHRMIMSIFSSHNSRLALDYVMVKTLKIV